MSSNFYGDTIGFFHSIVVGQTITRRTTNPKSLRVSLCQYARQSKRKFKTRLVNDQLIITRVL
jgi:hypothetical protein